MQKTAYERAQEILNDIYAAQDAIYRELDTGDVFPSLCQVDNCWALAKRLQRAESRKPGQTLPIYVALQETSRHYGGPEEGGWWYNLTETIEVYRFWSARDALVKVRELRKENPSPRYDIYSAANQGEPAVSIVVAHDPSYWTVRETHDRPVYS